MIVASFSDFDKLNSVSKLAAELQAYVQEAAHQGRPLHEVERNVFKRTLQIGFTAVEYFLRAQGDGDLGASITTDSGQELHRGEEVVQRPLRTIFGQHTIEAFVYAPGPKQRIMLRPIDVRLQLSDRGASYVFEEFSQYFCVEQAFGQASAGIEMVLGQPVSVDSLERTNKLLGEQAGAFLETLPTPEPTAEGELLVFTGDGKGVPLVKDDVANLAAFEDAPERPGNRRMATLAGVYSVDRYVRTPEQIVEALFRDGQKPLRDERPEARFKHIRACFAQTYDAHTDAPTVISGTFEAFGWAERQVATRLQPNQPLIRLMDGQRSLWDAADVCLVSMPADLTIDILDILHVSKYVWRAAKVFHRSFEHREAFARERLLRILQGGVKSVILGLRQMASKHKLSGERRREIRTVCRYFSHNVDRMRYDEYLREGYPIATGVIEGACRHFVKDRMERSGMRWRLAGAQPMLNVRAVFLSPYWDQFHVHRIDREQRKLHPNKNIMADYTPAPLLA